MNIYDVVVIGAGISGIDAAYRIQTNCPSHSFTILEGRENLGGTWDLFKYPGIRSDSDMYTFGFPFSPWKNDQAISDAGSILEYLNDTVDKFDIRKRIQFNTKVLAADWSSEEACWTLKVEQQGQVKTFKSNFIYMGTGYYDYENGYQPVFPNQDDFEGSIIHPQKWDTTLDYSNKEIIIIGSGATAVTLMPELAKKAKKVTLLQRSPTYILAFPKNDKIANFFKKIMPSKMAHNAAKWKNIMTSIWLYKACRKWPNTMRKFFKKNIAKILEDKYEDKHFNPKYNPWDQRLCLVPDADMFKTIKSGKGVMVTDTIKSFTKSGILLDSGKALNADIIVTATGLNIKVFGGIKGTVDGKLIDTSQIHTYRGCMASEVPNLVFAVGYTNASWTLKVDLVAQFTTRLLNHMKKNNYKACTPRFDTDIFKTERLLDFDAGYILRAKDQLPKQGNKLPWKIYQHYIKDVFMIKYGKVKDKYLEYR
ncbi:MAG: NAD(P)/FAD-dependent oxidoreductase [Winogradskyella sp.]